MNITMTKAQNEPGYPATQVAGAVMKKSSIKIWAGAVMQKLHANMNKTNNILSRAVVRTIRLKD